MDIQRTAQAHPVFPFTFNEGTSSTTWTNIPVAVIPVKPNTSYTITNTILNTTNWGFYATYEDTFYSNKCLKHGSGSDCYNESITVTSPNDANWLVVGFNQYSSTQLTLADDVEGLQIEQGAVSTPYTEYQEPVVYTLPYEEQDSWGIKSDIFGDSNSLEWNQLVKSISSTDWVSANSNVQYLNNEAVFTATANNGYVRYARTTELKYQHRYFVTAAIKGSSESTTLNFYALGGYITKSPQITTSYKSYDYITSKVEVFTPATFIGFFDKATDNFVEYSVKNAYIVDLTQMFGAGNEPTNVSDAKISWIKRYLSKHPEDTTGELIYAPFNERNFNTGKRIQRIGKIVLDGVNRKFSGAFGAVKNGYCVYYTGGNFSHFNKMISDRFSHDTVTRESMPLYGFGGADGADVTKIFILPSSITSVAEANEWLVDHPTTIYYELDTPIETDLNQAPIKLNINEASYITFNNDDKLLVPNEVIYKVPLDALEVMVTDLYNSDVEEVESDDNI